VGELLAAAEFPADGEVPGEGEAPAEAAPGKVDALGVEASAEPRPGSAASPTAQSVGSGACAPLRIKTPMHSKPCCFRSQADTAESTPPDIATMTLPLRDITAF
jgi:hypothetical protein